MTGSVPDKVRFGIGLIGIASISVVLWSLVWALVAPLFFGWSPIAVTSGSMEPLIATGDIVFVASSDGRDLAPGTVIVFEDAASGGRVTHRIVDVTPEGDYVTRGDANGRLDSTPVAPDQVAGVGRMIIPALGLPIVWADRGEWFLLALAVMAMFAAATASRWAVLGRFSPWRNRSLVPPTPTAEPAATPAAGSPALPGPRRRAPVLVGVALGVLAAVGVTTVQSRAAFVGATENSGDVVTADTLQPPTAVLATGGATVTIDWTITPDTYADGHTIHRGTAPGGPYALVATTTPRTVATYIDSPPAGTYYYVVRAIEANWQSVESNEVSAVVGVTDDYDAVPAMTDNCPTTFNVDQYDTDGDGIGDACDSSPTVASSGGFTDSGQALGSGDTGGVVFADVDGDGDLDAMTSNGGANRVWLNDGAGTFTDSGQALGSGDGEGLAMADLDGDGDIDAMTADDGQANRVWLNNGSGIFTDSGQALDPGDSWGVAFGDFDGDDDLDAFVANNLQPNTVWLNDGSGTFTNSGQTLGSAATKHVVVGDVDGDGDLDAVDANNGANRVWLNNGTGTFTDSGQALGSATTIGVALADVDGDGDADVVFANNGANRVWLNNGTGTFTDSGQTLGGATSDVVVLGDLDGDGDPDALFGNNGANRVWWNNGTGTFTDSGQALGSATTQSMALGDIDGDGDLDAYFGNGGANSVWINDTAATDDYDAVLAGSDNCPTTFNVDQFDTDGDGTGDACDSSPTVASSGLFTSSGQALGSGTTEDLAVGDLDADGDLDIVEATGTANAVWINDGSGTFTGSGQTLGSVKSVGVALGDLDDDGDLDAMFSNTGANSTVWLNDGGGTFTNSGQSLGTGGDADVAFGDFDGDGDLDAILAGNGPNTVWLNDGAGTFTDSGQSLGAAKTDALALGDLDGDGDLDTVFANTDFSDTVWLNDGVGTFTDTGQALGATTTGDVSVGDVDADGDLDAVFANQAVPDTVWRNDGTGTFTDTGQALGAVAAKAVDLGDIDGDGDIDSAFGNNAAIKLWVNDGGGTMTDSGQALSVANASDVVLADVDGDGDLDAVVGEKDGANSVWINDAGPAVGLANSWQTGLTHTAGAGTDRMLVFVATNEQQSLAAPTLTGVTYGGQPLTYVMANGVGNDCCHVRSEIWVLDEAGLAAASGTGLVPTWSTTPNTPLYSHIVYENVDQSDPFGAQTSATVIGDTPNPVPMSPVVTSNGDMVLAVAVAGEAGTYTAQNGFTLGIMQSTTTGGTTASGTAQKTATGANETVSMLFNPAAPPWTNRQVALALVLHAAP